MHAPHARPAAAPVSTAARPKQLAGGKSPPLGAAWATLILIAASVSGSPARAGEGEGGQPSPAARPACARVAIDAPAVATFSIVAADPATGELGVAVQSKFLAVGSVVPWARAGVGAVATQAWANTTFGPGALELLAAGHGAQQAVDQLVAADRGSSRRQLAVVDANGAAASFTGVECVGWAGGVTGDGFAVQGNLLAGEEVVAAMAESFRASGGGGQTLSERLIAALRAGQAAGGDKRGRQSAALLVVRDGWGYSGFNDRFRDLRVDDHPTPIEELERIYRLHRKIVPHPQGPRQLPPPPPPDDTESPPPADPPPPATRDREPAPSAPEHPARSAENESSELD